MDWTAVWQFLTATDERTWVGHGFQGLVFGFLGGLTGTGHGVLLTFGIFGHREADDYWRLMQVLEMNAFMSERELRAFRRRKMLDGYMDLWAPFAGAILGEAALLILKP